MSVMNTSSKSALLVILLISLFIPIKSNAHRSSCHNLHTCPSDSDSYVCGDLGYPCDGSTSITDIPLSKIHVPLLIESTFSEIFDRKPTDRESVYWKARFRAEKNSIYKVRRAMNWHKAHNSFGPKAIATPTTSKVRIKDINALFRGVYDGRNPTVSENQYWITRIQDKPTPEALVGAMAYHKHHGIQH